MKIIYHLQDSANTRPSQACYSFAKFSNGVTSISSNRNLNSGLRKYQQEDVVLLIMVMLDLKNNDHS